MPRLAFLLLVTACAALAGCFNNATNARVTGEYAVTVKKVGVMALLDPAANVSHLVGSAQESRFGKLVLPDLDSHAIALAGLEQRLARRGFQVSELAADEAVLAAYGKDWGAPTDPGFHAALAARGAAAGVDLVVAVCRQVRSDDVTGTNQKVRGHGIQRAFDEPARAYAFAYVAAIDVGDGHPVGLAEGVQVESLDPALWLPGFDQAEGDMTVPPTVAAALTAQLARLLANAVGIAAQEAGF